MPCNYRSSPPWARLSHPRSRARCFRLLACATRAPPSARKGAQRAEGLAGGEGAQRLGRGELGAEGLEGGAGETRIAEGAEGGAGGMRSERNLIRGRAETGGIRLVGEAAEQRICHVSSPGEDVDRDHVAAGVTWRAQVLQPGVRGGRGGGGGEDADLLSAYEGDESKKVWKAERQMQRQAEQESAEQNHMCARYEKALDSFLSCSSPPPHLSSSTEQESAEQNHMCARYEKALDSFVSTPTTPALEPAAAVEPDLLFVFARKKQTPLDSDATARPKSRPPWLQWTLVAQLALPPLTLTTALHEIRAAATDTATDSADNPAAIHDAGSTAGAAGEVNTGRAATGAAIATGSASSDSPAAAAAAAVASDSAGVWFSSQKMDEHVQRWLMGRIPKRAWSDVAQCVAWYRPDLIFTRHPSFE
ncbi:unnamed protein product, partial [Closterium sp. NIES-65]